MLTPFTIAAAVALSTGVAREGAQDVEWRTDLAQATAEATRDGRPLLVVFR